MGTDGGASILNTPDSVTTHTTIAPETFSNWSIVNKGDYLVAAMRVRRDISAKAERHPKYLFGKG